MRIRAFMATALAGTIAVAGAGAARGAIITFGVNNGDVAQGQIDLGDVYKGQGQPGSATWINPAGAGFDIRLSSTSWDGEVPLGSAKSRGNDKPVVTLEFFLTGTVTPVDVRGLKLTFGDLDQSTPAVDWQVTSGGAVQPLPVDSYFLLGSSLSAADLDGDGVKDDIASAISVSGNDFGDARINATIDLGSFGISALSFKSNDFVHIGRPSIDVADMSIVPEPTTLALAAAGVSLILARRRKAA